MMPARLLARPLTGPGFASFGDVIELPPGAGVSVNQGRGLRFDMAAGLAGLEGDAPLRLALYQVTPSALPLAVALLERHPLSAQIFLPMLCDSYALVVAPPDGDGAPDIAKARAFIARGDQGVLYRRDVWHHPIVALKATAQFAMLIRENGEPDNCIEFQLPHPLLVAE